MNKWNEIQKMKLASLILSLLFVGFKYHAQDLIITPVGDSLNCKITKIDPLNIYFSWKPKDKVMNSMLAKGNVKYYSYNFFPIPAFSASEINNEENKGEFGFSVFGGYSYIVAPVSPDVSYILNNYVEQLRSGYHFGADGFYFVKQFMSIGARYSMMRTSGRLDNIVVTNSSGTTYTGVLKDDITIQYVGPLLGFKLSSKNRLWNFYSDISYGYLHYRNNAVLIEPFTLTGATTGAYLSLGTDYVVSGGMTLGLVFSFTAATLEKVNISSAGNNSVLLLDKDHREGISRVDISLLLKFIN